MACTHHLFRERNDSQHTTGPRPTTDHPMAVEESTSTHNPQEEELVTGFERKHPIQESLQGRLAPSVSISTLTLKCP